MIDIHHTPGAKIDVGADRTAVIEKDLLQVRRESWTQLQILDYYP